MRVITTAKNTTSTFNTVFPCPVARIHSVANTAVDHIVRERHGDTFSRLCAHDVWQISHSVRLLTERHLRRHFGCTGVLQSHGKTRGLVSSRQYLHCMM